MSLQLVANHLAQKGRGPDSNLVHMSNREVAGLQALAKKHGGSLTTNPQTGLPEAGFLDSILPTLAGGALTYFSGGAISPMMSAGIVGGISALDSKDLGKGLMAGLGAYGGAGLTQGLMGAGLGAVGPGLSEKAAADAAAQGLTGDAYKQAVQNQVASGLAEKNLASEGVSQLFKNPGQTFETIGGGSGLNAARTAFAAAAPAIMADQNVKTATPAPERGKIRPYTFNAQQMNPSQTGPVSGEKRYFNNQFTAGEPYAAANGGLVALARGGYAQQPLFRPTAPLPENNMYGASREAYDYLMGLNPTSGGNMGGGMDNTGVGMGGTGGGAGTGGGTGSATTTPKTGTGHYAFDPATQQYTWIPDPIKSTDTTSVLENTTKTGGTGAGGGGYGSSAEGRAEREAQMRDFEIRDPEEYAHRNDWIGETLGTVGKFLVPGGLLMDMFKKPVDMGITPEEADTLQNEEAHSVRDLEGNLVRQIDTPAANPLAKDPATLAAEKEAAIKDLIADSDKSAGWTTTPVTTPTSSVGTVPTTSVAFNPTTQPDSVFPAGTNYTDKAFTTDNFGRVLAPGAQVVNGATTSPNTALAAQNSAAGSSMQGALNSLAQSTPAPAAEPTIPVNQTWNGEDRPSEKDGWSQVSAGQGDTKWVRTVNVPMSSVTNSEGGVDLSQLAGTGWGSYGNTVSSNPNGDGRADVSGIGGTTYGSVAAGYTGGSEAAAGGLSTPYGFRRMAHGGIADLHQYNLGSYSDGGRLLKGPGDGVSDDIPATIGHGQPARLADGEFVIPARIVSELGNGSTDAGARELYKMMDRIQAGRKKTVGKDQVAKNSKSARHLPA